MTKADTAASLGRLSRETTLVAGINRIFRDAPTARTEEALWRLCLAVVEDVTGAAFGFLGEMHGDRFDLVISDRGRAAAAACEPDPPDPPDAATPDGFAIHALWARVVRDGETVIANGLVPDGDGDRSRGPSGLPALHAFLGVPLRVKGATLAMIGLGNRDDGFRTEHADAVESLSPAIVQVILGRRVEMALLISERRLQSLVNGVPELVWRSLDDGLWTWASPQWGVYTGQVGTESHGEGWLDPVHPDDRDGVRRLWRQARARGLFEAEFRLLHAGERRYRWFQTRAVPVRDDAGGIVEWVGTSTDIDDMRRLQRRQRILVTELQHRVRTILTVVRTLFARTIGGGDVRIDDRIDHFKARLDSFARTQVILTQNGSGAIDLEELVREELLTVGAQEGPGVRIGGPDVRLSAVAAETIGLALHELTMNAVKYGALKVTGGTLDIHWQIAAQDRERPMLRLSWTEGQVPAVAVTPTHSGFGTDLIERILPYQLGAETILEFRGGGVHCAIAIPLPAPPFPEDVVAEA